MKTFTEYTELLNDTFTKKDVIAPVESSSEASKAYVVGEKFFYNNILYEATDVIASGGIIDPGTNCEEAEDIVSQIENKTIVTDAVPTQGSTNPVQSGGVYDSLSPVYNVLGAKNLLPFSYYDTSKTSNGITWTVNSDGSISASGTATADSFFRFTKDSDLSIYNNTILSGCPANGGMWSKWALYLSGSKDGQTVLKYDIGSGVLIEDIPTGYSGGIYAKVINGQTVNFTFKPMIRPASITDDTYVPYSMTNQQMTPYVQAISNPNLLDNPWFTVNQRGVTSYSANSYGVDRWKCSTMSNRTIEVVANGIKDSSTGSEITTHCFYQIIDAVGLKLKGKTVTATVYIPEITSDTNVNFLCRKSNWSGFTSLVINTAGYHSMTFTIPSDTTDTIIIDCELASVIESGKYVIIGAVKLELGSVSTLAMDTAPNYQQELAKCQRYFQRLGYPNDSTYEPLGSGFAKNANLAYIFCPLRTQMRSTPTVTLEGKVYVQDISIGVHACPCTINASTARGVNALILYLVPDTADKFTAGNAMTGYFNQSINGTPNSYFDVSADL